MGGETIRILYQFATAKAKTDLGMAEVERRRRFLNERVGPGVTVDVAVPERGPGSIESDYEAAMAVPQVLASIGRAEASGYDAAIISCFSDPGLDAAREIVSIPVVGSGQASMHVAAQLGARFAIISPLDAFGSRAAETPRKCGLGQLFAGAQGMGMSVLDLARDRAACLERVAEAGRRAVEEDGADVLVLGCMSMAFHDVTGELQARLGVPVVNPVPASLALAELLARTGLAHSKRAWPRPPKMEFLG
jgi:allantoin racemase